MFSIYSKVRSLFSLCCDTINETTAVFSRFAEGGIIVANHSGFFSAEVFSDEGGFQTSNLYLYRGNSRGLLIDAGFNTDLSKQKTMKLLEQCGVTPDTLDVFLTHNHPDHAGMAALLHSMGAMIYAAPAEASTRALICRYYDEGPDSAVSILRFYGFSEKEAENIYSNTMKPVYSYHRYNMLDFPFLPVMPGAVFSDETYSLEVLSLSGHTAGSLGLIDHNGRRLFTGDCIGGKDVFLISATRYGDRLWERQQETLSRLKTYEEYCVFPGHGAPFSGMEEPIRNTKLYFEKLCRRILRSADGELRSVRNYLASVFGYRPGRMTEEEGIRLHFRMANLLACLEWLTDHGDLDLSMRDETAYWNRKS